MQLHPGSVFSSVTEPFRIRLLLLVWESYNRVSMSSALGLWPQLRKPYMRGLSIGDQPRLLLQRTAGDKEAANMLSGEVMLGSDLRLACSNESLYLRVAN